MSDYRATYASMLRMALTGRDDSVDNTVALAIEGVAGDLEKLVDVLLKEDETEHVGFVERVRDRAYVAAQLARDPQLLREEEKPKVTQ